MDRAVMRYLIFFLALYAALGVTALAWYVKALAAYTVPPGVQEPAAPRKPIRIFT